MQRGSFVHSQCPLQAGDDFVQHGVCCLRSGSQCGRWDWVWFGACVQRRRVCYGIVQWCELASVWILRDSDAHVFKRSMGIVG